MTPAFTGVVVLTDWQPNHLDPMGGSNITGRFEMEVHGETVWKSLRLTEVFGPYAGIGEEATCLLIFDHVPHGLNIAESGEALNQAWFLSYVERTGMPPSASS